eukprot:CAMPEP_0202902016 /NCGR_PEP_ID=MMETSP1392-20130828/15897_1 /ASSEMBLY_ACC=CAM_ASM_000868 /TAXON_ID=225041 /ORGANISM="Chlamydomonas chlamydogama, Strain SAG 11-48b" /LENGTH=164 /DNA_ID=CAMNT_0049588693 /DNA_START=126 /DNA_END=620 /DNA_ORIENTATION=-
MSDFERHDETFERADAGAALTYPVQAGLLRKNEYMLMSGTFPCKIIEVSISKTGKHGHAKCHFTGIDIFTGRKYEELVPSTLNCDVPRVTAVEYSVLDISDQRLVEVMAGDGATKHLRLPTSTEYDEKLADQLVAQFNQGSNMIVVVTEAMGNEKISSLKIIKG